MHQAFPLAALPAVQLFKTQTIICNFFVLKNLKVQLATVSLYSVRSLGDLFLKILNKIAIS